MTGKTSSWAPSRTEVLAYLADEILSGGTDAGTKLPSERDLADRFGVSWPVVREAMRGLVERGLVEVQPGRGAFVRAAQPTDAAAGMDALLRRHQPTRLLDPGVTFETLLASVPAGADDGER